ncbi:hypothetical protein ZWY2020_047341 [Hordeum vulgare]|nr:hypothetical protein ZWY2020_047341 [Hordeum vulgare]
MKRMCRPPDEVSFSVQAILPMFTSRRPPKQVVRTLNRGSNVMSLDFHPVQQTILLVGTNVGDIGIWEVGSRKDSTRHLKFGTLAPVPCHCSCTNERSAICVNRCLWSHDGNILG